MQIKIILIECDMPACKSYIRSQFVTTAERIRYENAAKRDGWREVRVGFEMAIVCPGHPEVI